MDIYERALRKLRSEKRGYNELSRLSGIPAETLRDVRNGATASPRFDTLKKLVKIYEEKRT